ATVDKGVTIITPKVTANKTIIKNGCKFVKFAIKSPKSAVALATYGNVNLPIRPGIIPPRIGTITIVKSGRRLPYQRIINTEIITVIIVFTRSPVPFNTQPSPAKLAAPLPIKAAPATAAVCIGAKPNCIAVNIPTKKGTEKENVVTICDNVTHTSPRLASALKTSLKIALGIKPTTIPIAAPFKILFVNSPTLIFGVFSIFFISYNHQLLQNLNPSNKYHSIKDKRFRSFLLL